MGMRVRMGMRVLRSAVGGVVVIIAAGGVSAGITVLSRVLGRRLSGFPASVVVHIEAASLENDGRHGNALFPLAAALWARSLPGVVIPLPHGEPVRAGLANIVIHWHGC